MSEQGTKLEKLTESQFHTVWTSAIGMYGYNKTMFAALLHDMKEAGLISPSPPEAVGETLGKAAGIIKDLTGALKNEDALRLMDAESMVLKAKEMLGTSSPSPVIGEAEKKRRAMKPMQIIIDNKPFEHDFCFITGREIKEYVNAPARYSVWLKGTDGKSDVELLDDENLDLEREGRKYFFTGPRTTTEGSPSSVVGEAEGKKRFKELVDKATSYLRQTDSQSCTCPMCLLLEECLAIAYPEFNPRLSHRERVTK